MPSPLKNGMVPLDIDVTQFDNSKTHKEGVEGIAMGALSHHERYDGKGYPHGLAGENIPLVARIICVSDSFDAMNSHRCYRSSLPTEVILNELLSNKGTQFDPMVIDGLLSIIEDGAITVTGNENGNIPV